MFSDFCLCHLCAKKPFSKSGAKKCQKVPKRDIKCHLASNLQKATPENMPLHGQETVKFWMLYQPLTTIEPPTPQPPASGIQNPAPSIPAPPRTPKKALQMRPKTTKLDIACVTADTSPLIILCLWTITKASLHGERPFMSPRVPAKIRRGFEHPLEIRPA